MPQRRHLIARSGGMKPARGAARKITLQEIVPHPATLQSPCHRSARRVIDKLKHRAAAESGIGVVEVIIAITILVLVSMSVLQNSEKGISTSAELQGKTEAIGLANQELNQLYSVMSTEPSIAPPSGSGSSTNAFPWPFGSCSGSSPYVCSLLAAAQASSYPQSITIQSGSGDTQQNLTYALTTQGQWECPTSNSQNPTPVFVVSVSVSWTGMGSMANYPAQSSESIAPPVGAATPCACLPASSC